MVTLINIYYSTDNIQSIYKDHVMQTEPEAMQPWQQYSVKQCCSSSEQ